MPLFTPPDWTVPKPKKMIEIIDYQKFKQVVIQILTAILDSVSLLGQINIVLAWRATMT